MGSIDPVFPFYSFFIFGKWITYPKRAQMKTRLTRLGRQGELSEKDIEEIKLAIASRSARRWSAGWWS